MSILYFFHKILDITHYIKPIFLPEDTKTDINSNVQVKTCEHGSNTSKLLFRGKRDGVGVERGEGKVGERGRERSG